MTLWRYRSTILDISTRYRWVVTFTLRPLYIGDTPAGYEAGWVRTQWRKGSPLVPTRNPTPDVHPYTDWANWRWQDDIKMDLKEIGNKPPDSIVVSEVLVLPGDLRVVLQEWLSSLYSDELLLHWFMKHPIAHKMLVSVLNLFGLNRMEADNFPCTAISNIRCTYVQPT